MIHVRDTQQVKWPAANLAEHGPWASGHTLAVHNSTSTPRPPISFEMVINFEEHFQLCGSLYLQSTVQTHRVQKTYRQSREPVTGLLAVLSTASLSVSPRLLSAQCSASSQGG